MRVHQIQKYHRSGLKQLLIMMIFYFLFYVSVTPYVFGLEEDIKVELEMNESFEDTHELTEEFLKEIGSDFKNHSNALTTIEDLNGHFLNSFQPEIPIPPPKFI